MGLADFLVRSAYQMGKTPLLPIFAASLGAGDSFVGLIISVSTLTGMIFKPVIGFLSDTWGRKSWLLVGTAFFTFMPFVIHSSILLKLSSLLGSFMVLRQLYMGLSP